MDRSFINDHNGFMDVLMRVNAIVMWHDGGEAIANQIRNIRAVDLDRPNWYDNIKDYVYRFQGPSYKECPTCGIATLKCKYCNYNVTPEGLQIDHIIQWRAYIGMYEGQTTSNGRARVLYNDPNNLRLLCVQCNAGERNMQGVRTRGMKNNRKDNYLGKFGPEGF